MLSFKQPGLKLPVDAAVAANVINFGRIRVDPPKVVTLR